MVKVPQTGRVKTRLGREIGYVAAAWWFRHQVRRLLRHVRDDRQWQLIICISPDIAAANTRVFAPSIRRIAQGRGHLGQRMARAIQNQPPGPVVLIGADIPGIRARHIASAFRALGSHDAVFGPARDGGFWLVGFRRTRPLAPNLFENVRWSSEFALRDTLRGLNTNAIAMLETLDDVDLAADL